MPESPSTNATLVDLARRGAPMGTVVTTDHQSAGRGRLDRTWVTPARSAIAVSVLLSPNQVPIKNWVWLPMLVGLAVDATVNAAGVSSALKWPNDVIVGDRKLAGILLERIESPAGAAVVAGMGLNVSMTTDELPVAEATSLAIAGATALDRTVLLRSYLRNLEALYTAWVAAEGSPAAGIHDSYVRRCATLGQRVKVSTPDARETAGMAEAIDENGRLVVGGQPFSAGDVVHVRSTS